MNNGTILPTRPSMGSWLSWGLGSENQNLPSYVVLCPGKPVRFSILWTSAFLPGSHQGTYINHSDTTPDKLIPFLRNLSSNRVTQAAQLELMNRLNRRHIERSGEDSQLEARIQAMETAFRMQFTATDAFDLQQESKSTRELYGQGHFANGCLLARRLAERGVRFIQVYYGDGQPWDTHSDHNNAARNLSNTIDRPIAALLSDLKQRGLLDDTLILWGGEFGRTPTSENGSGRDHNHYGFTTFLAGGGVRGGMTWGETDEFGFRAVHNRVHIHDLHATILHLLGLDHEQLTYRYAGRDFRLTDVAGNVIQPVIS
jgi:arylsulfatase A-like enzyme